MAEAVEPTTRLNILCHLLIVRDRQITDQHKVVTTNLVLMRNLTKIGIHKAQDPILDMMTTRQAIIMDKVTAAITILVTIITTVIIVEGVTVVMIVADMVGETVAVMAEVIAAAAVVETEEAMASEVTGVDMEEEVIVPTIEKVAIEMVDMGQYYFIVQMFYKTYITYPNQQVMI